MQSTINTCLETAALLSIESFFPTGCAWGRLRRCGQERVTVVDLDQLEADETELLLSEAERHYFERFRSPKRRREWLGGRIAAKLALLNSHEPELFWQQAQRLTILPDEHGRPTVSGQVPGNSLSLSISHSGGHAVALAVQGATSCGIDLQKISDKLPALINYFASSAELELLACLPEIGSYETRLTMLWAMKEAVKKSVLADQPAMFAGIEVQRISTAGEHGWRFECAVQGSPVQTATVYPLAPYVLALTVRI